MTGPGDRSGADPEVGAHAPSGGFRKGSFGVTGSGDTSGFGGLVRVEPGGAVALHSTERPYGGYFDEVTDALIEAVGQATYDAAVQRVLVDRGEITYFVAREHLPVLAQALRDDDALRFELCSSVSGVDYLDSGGPVATPDRPRLHVVYHLTSMTYRRRIRLEVAVTAEDAHVPVADRDLPDGRLARARDVGHVRDRLRRPPGAHPHPHARRLGRAPAAQGLPARRGARGVPRRHDSSSGHPKGVPMSTTYNAADPYAGSRETTEGRVYTVTGGDWDLTFADATDEERLVVNMGPQHPSTHGVLRLILDLEGETVTKARVTIGYLHTGIEKNTEYRNWTQGTTFVTRMDYLAPLFNEAGYCMAVEKLLGVEIPQRAATIRVLVMEINRIASHLVGLATGGMELGALTAMTNGFREREMCLDLLEEITGLRMNHAYIRPGGLAQDLPEGAVEHIREFLKIMPKRVADFHRLLTGQPIWQRRLKDVGFLDVTGCLALGVTGPILRAAGLPWDMRKTEPYLGYETYDFEVPTADTADAWGRYLVRMAEVNESLKLIEQALDRLEPGPVMVEDRKIAWPAQLSLGADGMGNSLDHVRHIMGQSMEALIHHFKLVTEGFRVPAGQVYVPIESPRGELGYHVVSDGSTRPWRVHVRDPSFVNLQATAAMSEGGMIADVIAAVASIDPVMGGVDR